MFEPWHLRGSLVGACNCDWGCPCNFDAPPTRGHCDGAYAVAVAEGGYGDVSLDGVRFVFGGHSPAAIHHGGGLGVLIVDHGADERQRRALETLSRGGGVGLPFDIFAATSERWLDTLVADVEITVDGMRSSARVDGGGVMELTASRIPNPVTGIDEQLYLDKPTGFTSTGTELGMTQTFRLAMPGFSVDASGLYAEYAEFAWSGPPPRG